MESMEFRRSTAVRLARLLFYAYLLLLLWVLFLQRAGTARLAWDDYSATAQMNLRPFATIDRYVRAIAANQVLEIAYVNLAGNLALFMPLGLLLPLGFLQYRTPWRFFLLILVLLPAVEALQLLLRCGCCDVDDVILNLIGAAAAYLIALPLTRHMRAEKPEETPQTA